MLSSMCVLTDVFSYNLLPQGSFLVCSLAFLKPSASVARILALTANH